MAQLGFAESRIQEKTDRVAYLNICVKWTIGEYGEDLKVPACVHGGNMPIRECGVCCESDAHAAAFLPCGHIVCSQAPTSHAHACLPSTRVYHARVSLAQHC